MWDKKADRGLLSQNEIESHGELLAEYHRLEHISTSKIRQKCCVKWAVEGDKNTRYPHASSNGFWITDPSQLKFIIYDHFLDRFIEPPVQRPVFSMLAIS